MTTLQITIPEGVEVLSQEMELILAARPYELQYLARTGGRDGRFD